MFIRTRLGVAQSLSPPTDLRVQISAISQSGTVQPIRSFEVLTKKLYVFVEPVRCHSEDTPFLNKYIDKKTLKN